MGSLCELFCITCSGHGPGYRALQPPLYVNTWRELLIFVKVQIIDAR